MTLEELEIRIKSFSDLKDNWDGYGADKITEQSILVAISLLDSLSKTNDKILVYPMRNGGIQFEIGDYKEIEIFNNDITELFFDSELNIVSELKREYK
jgi:hypothetical protein